MKSNLTTNKTKIFFRRSLLPIFIATFWVVDAITLVAL